MKEMERRMDLHVAYWKDKASIEKWEKEAKEIISQKIEIDFPL